MKALYTDINEQNYQMLEILSQVKGVERNHIINEALECYFNAIKTTPEEFLLKPIYIIEDEFEKLKEKEPTEELKKLMNDN